MVESGRVLLIEDSPDEAALIISMLDKEGFSCEWAPTLAGGCAALRERPPSCVLVDPDRLDAAGLACLDQVVRVAPGTPFIVLTGRDDAAVGEVASRHGAQDYLDKGGMDQRLLARSVRYAIENRAADRVLGETRTRFSTALEAMLDGFALFSAVRNAAGALVDFTWDYVNAAGAATFGQAPGDLLGRRMCEVAPGIYASGLFDDYRRVVETGAALTLDALPYSDTGKGGSVDGIFDVHANKLGDGLVIVWRDVSERHRQERALAEARELFQSAFDGAPIGVAVVSLDPATPGRYLQANPALRELLGYPADHLVGRSVLDVTHPDDAADNATLLAQLADTTIERYSTTKRYVHADGHPIWVRVQSSPVRDASGRPSYTITHVEDITEAKQFHERLAHQATHDPLTGLANRHLLVARLQHSLDALGRTGAAVGVLYLDLDGFKTVNDSAGHAAGDRVLAEVGRRLGSAVRRHDTAARIGGDEFVIVAGQLAADHDVAHVIDRVKAALAPPIVIDGDAFAASASIGVVVTRNANDDPSELLRAADTAMYRAKQAGRSRHEIFNETLRVEAIQRLDVEHDLRHALDAGRLRLHYQPVVNLTDGQMVGVEALLRLDHPTRGLLGPAEFLDVAENSGLIVPIGGWVITEACHQQAAWQASLGRPLHMAVNLSGRQLLQADLCEHVSATIDRAAMDPARLTLELTETVFTQASRSFLADLEALKARGVRFALDDFGTGFSSLAYLDRFPVDVVKIGPTFVAGLGRRTQDTGLVTAIVDLGHTLHLTVIAEGVETPDQLAALQEMGCDLVQGFHFARPSPADRIPGLLAGIHKPATGTATRR